MVLVPSDQNNDNYTSDQQQVKVQTDEVEQRINHAQV
jgi:hypothetical protein